MKQHYNKCICAVLIMLLVAAYFVNVSKKADPEVAGKPKATATKTKSNPPAPTDEKTMASIQQSLAKREYNISFDSEKKALQSPNRKQNLRTYYKPGAYTIQNRIDSAGHNFSLKLTNKGIFADGKKILSPQADAVLENLDNKLVIKHQGFSEEFINNEEGVRQNFIIDQAPVGTRELQVKLSAKGLKVDDLQNNELHFYAENKDGDIVNQLVYKDIKCWDKNGKTLPATLRFEDNLIALTVAVEGAAYPVTIDPIVINGNPANANATLESNQAGAQAGYAVSSAGDVNGDGYSDVIVGAPFFDKGENNEGVVFVYHGSASGVGVNPAIILEGNQKEAQFGTSAASAGDINKDGFGDIIIGAPYYDQLETNEGVAIIYYGSAAGINSTGTILESNQPEAILGRSVDGLGDINGDGFSDVIVGAPRFDKGENEEGAAFIYHGSAQGISTNPAIILESNQATAYFGQSVAAAGDVNGDGFNDVVIGSTHFDKGQKDEGVVFVFHGSAVGVTANAAALLEVNQASAAFGWAVSTAGDVNGDGYSDIIVGSYTYDNGQNNEGGAFVYHGSAQGIKTAAASKLESNQIDARQGISVACAGDVNGDGYSDILVGIWQYDKGESNEGAVILHYGTATGIAAMPASTIEGNQANAAMGWSVKSAGDVNGDGYSDIIVGANMYDNGQGDEGAAFVWMGMAEGVSDVAALKLEGNQNFAQMGWSVSDAGDVNGDGFDDVAIAANGYDNGQASEGAVFIYHGSKTGLNPLPITKIESNEVYASMGKVASAGDVNGDGYADIIIGVPLYGENNAGAAFVYHGSAQGILNSVQAKLAEQQGEDGNFGSSVACAGDVNGDGYSDVIVGAPGFDVVQQYMDEGMAFVYYGSANGLNINTPTKIKGSPNGFNMGASAGLGDVNGDGFGDIAIGNPFYTDGDDFEGAVSIHYGSVAGVKAISDLILQANKAECRLGSDVSKAGDINGDGYMDLIAGASHYAAGQYTEGAMYVYYGSQVGINAVPTIIESDKENSSFGNSISTAGDVNGDGYSDVIVGALGYSNGQVNEGAAFVFLGSMSGINAKNAFKLEGNQESAFLGNSVSGAGDVNGDGYSDIIMGAHQYDNGQTNEGIVYVYHGNGADQNLQNNLRLYNSNLTTPINQSQKAKNDFGAGLYAKSFLGKNKAKLVWETQAKGQGFSKGANDVITNSTLSTGSQNAYAGLGLKGVELKSVIAKQGPSTKVRVRVKYDPALALTGQVYGPWRYLPAYLLGNGAAPAPEDVVDDMSETVRRKVAVEDAQENAKLFNVYPNPVSDKLIFQLDGSNDVEHLQLLTTAGKSVYQKSGPVRELQVGDFAKGSYILIVTHNDGSRSTRKIIIE